MKPVLPRLALAASLLPTPVSAALLPGELDAGFGDGGVRLLEDTRPTGELPRQFLAAAPDGTVYVVSNRPTTMAGVARPEIARLDADGHIDAGFGTGGIARPAFGSAGAFTARDAIVDEQGRLLVAGQLTSGLPTSDDMAVCRFLADGTPDPEFGVDATPGCITQQFVGFASSANAVLVQDCPQAEACIDGRRIVVAGGVANGLSPQTMHGVALAWALDGSGVDASFGAGGLAHIVAAEPKRHTFVALSQDASGRLAIAGNRLPGGVDGSDMMALRLTAEGLADPAFGGDGYQPVPFDLGPPGTDEAFAVRLLPDGSVVVAGTALDAAGFFVPAVARVRADGILDPAFDGGNAVDEGRVVADVCAGEEPCSAVAFDLDLRADGRMVLAGMLATPDALKMAAIRLLPDGALDPGFRSAGSAVGGLAVVDLPGADATSAASTLLLQGDRIVLAGVATRPEAGTTPYRVVLARLGNGEAPLFADGFEAP